MERKVVFCTPSLAGPTSPYIKALEDSIPLILGAGWSEGYVQELGNPYISAARATMLRKAMDASADVVVFLDYDLSWEPKDLLTLIETEGDVVAGTYRFKGEPEHYMGSILSGIDGRPWVRKDGCIKAKEVPAGFLKITKEGVDKFMTAYPELCYGPKYWPSVDLFNHGAWKGVWWGEDYSFSRRWNESGNSLWVIPDLNINHHKGEVVFKGNFHRWLLKQPGGSDSDCPNPPGVTNVSQS